MPILIYWTKIMIKILLIATTFICGGQTQAQSISPVSEALSVSPYLVARGFYKYKMDINLLTEIENRSEGLDLDYKHLRYGLKYRVHENIKIGVYLKHAVGLRHDNDWVKNTGTGKWGWTDSSSRVENLLMTEVTSRLLLDNYLLKNFMAEFRVQYNYNFNFNLHMLKIRPSLTYFLTKNGKAFMNLYINNEFYMALNFHESSIYQQWLYLGAQYHYSKKLKLGGFLARMVGTWTSSDDFIDRTGESYSKNISGTYLGFNINYYFK